MPPDPPRCLRLRRSRGALRRQENIHVRCFQKYVRYFTKQLKTLLVLKYILAAWLSLLAPETEYF